MRFRGVGARGGAALVGRWGPVSRRMGAPVTRPRGHGIGRAAAACAVRLLVEETPVTGGGVLGARVGSTFWRLCRRWQMRTMNLGQANSSLRLFVQRCGVMTSRKPLGPSYDETTGRAGRDIGGLRPQDECGGWRYRLPFSGWQASGSGSSPGNVNIH